MVFTSESLQALKGIREIERDVEFMELAARGIDAGVEKCQINEVLIGYFQLVASSNDAIRRLDPGFFATARTKAIREQAQVLTSQVIKDVEQHVEETLALSCGCRVERSSRG